MLNTMKSLIYKQMCYLFRRDNQLHKIQAKLKVASFYAKMINRTLVFSLYAFHGSSLIARIEKELLFSHLLIISPLCGMMRRG